MALAVPVVHGLPESAVLGDSQGAGVGAALELTSLAVEGSEVDGEGRHSD